ncbi:MAG TPA: hypothetical protein VFR18_11520, partial [Terriglobia bacterium]|nr:hypothetical protein [Terriglobia bacterium]
AISDHLVSARPGKLRWLQGGRDTVSWNAYEVVHGESLWDRVRNRGCLSWSQTVNVLLDVTSELDARIVSGECKPLSLQHIWVNSSSHHAVATSARVLEFPAATSEGANGFDVDAGNAKDFVYTVLVFAMTGANVVNPSASKHLAIPLPEHARAFARRLESGKQVSIGSMRNELQRLRARPAEIGLPRRAAMLGATASLPVVLALSLTAVPMINAIRLPQWQRELERLPIYDLWSNLLEDRKTPEARNAAVSICKALAWIGQEAAETANGRRSLAQLKPFQRSRLEDCRSQYRSVTASEAADARKVAEAYFIGRPLSSAQRDRQFAILRQGVDVFFWGGGVLWIVPVALSTVFPPGLCGRAMGVSLQTMRGQAPTAMRRVLRSICVWFPFVAFYPLLLTAAYLGYAPSATAYWKKEGFLAATLQLHGYSGILGTVDVLLLGLFGLGIIFALAKPHRGLPDFIAGTCLVPK